ncbi:lipid A-modifier LpxR family protein [Modicisalibacter xianhensis]|uniref:Uncharacterized protein n=1 Tax=Modicisalibacter xianhensis TaxID=442341 RepID=A0A1I3GH54_9GAMM|nr:lipid A-modifier LpxR family protein [Halomonas xianhensis]SFI22806.1 hypothetical protein SAMN04487959_1325 [Halomonas xianhensis]
MTTPRSRYLRHGLCLTMVILPAMATAEDSLYSLKLTNDTLSAGGDEHYTNGIEVTRVSIPDEHHWVRQLAAYLPGWSAQGLDAVGYHLAHQIYTPNDIQADALIEDDRPYAGLLLGGSHCSTTSSARAGAKPRYSTWRSVWSARRPVPKSYRTLRIGC